MIRLLCDAKFFLNFFQKSLHTWKRCVYLCTRKTEGTTVQQVFAEAATLHLRLRYTCGSSSAGRAQPCQGWGREFESRFPLQAFKQLKAFFILHKKPFALSLQLVYLCPTNPKLNSRYPNAISEIRNGIVRNQFSPRWWNGRHAGLKILWPLRPCGFESHPGHLTSHPETIGVARVRSGIYFSPTPFCIMATKQKATKQQQQAKDREENRKFIIVVLLATMVLMTLMYFLLV